MKTLTAARPTAAMTLVEVLVVVLMLVLLAAIFLPTLTAVKRKASKINCTDNLKLIGLSFSLWSSDDNGDKYPMEISTNNGGTRELVAMGDVVAPFQVVSNQLTTPKFLICPEDTNHIFAANFSDVFSAKNISYFIGIDASSNFPSAFLSGDANFESRGMPVKPGLFTIGTNTPVAWTAARHKFVGNIGLSDGSVQTVTISGLSNLLQQTGLATNRLAIP